VNDWTLEIDNFRPVDVLYLDFEKAFDRVPHQCLLVKLSHFGIREHLLKWIQAFLSNRTFHVKVADSISDERQVVSRVPQGSVLGPLLFVIYISDLSAVINILHAFYADDAKLYANALLQSSLLQSNLDRISQWCES
jgi:ribonuclease P/MRP protein subunit RPP40